MVGTLKPMTSDAVDHVDIGTEEIVVPEEMDSHPAFREATTGQTTGEKNKVRSFAWYIIK